MGFTQDGYYLCTENLEEKRFTSKGQKVLHILRLLNAYVVAVPIFNVAIILSS